MHFKSQCAKDAQAMQYGGLSYWKYLERHSIEKYNYLLKKGQKEEAEKMLTRSLSEALQGNEGN